MASNYRPYPFTVKGSSLDGFKTVGTDSYSDFQYGDVLAGKEYPLSSSIKSDFFFLNHNAVRIRALKNTLNYYIGMSRHYTFSSSLGDKSLQDVKLVSIPSIFYGSSIRKGSISCKWYLTGTLIAELQDIKQNGELIQVGPYGSTGSGSVAGVALYNEGFLLLTGSWSLHPTYTDAFRNDLTYYSPAWKYYMNTGSSYAYSVPSSSFDLEFEGTNYINVLNIFAHAEKGEFNHSNNPTYVKYSDKNKQPFTGTYSYFEDTTKQIKNIVKTNYSDAEPKLEKTTYISQIGLYDEQRNLIAIAKLSTPVRKRQNDNYVFKLKLDI